MTQRTLAGLLAVPLVLALGVLALTEPLPYVTYQPGLTVDVLGVGQDREGPEIVRVSSGAETYRDDGELRLTTVYVTQPDTEVNLLQLVGAWIDPDDAIYPYDAIYGPQDTDKSQEVEGAMQMATSQDNATAVALTELGYDVDPATVVASVQPGTPAKGRLKQGDVIASVAGQPVTTPAEAAEAVDKAPVDEPVDLTIVRDGDRRTLSILQQPVEGEPRIGIQMRSSYDFPVDVSVNVNPDIGGPSAGLMFSLAIYDTLTEGSLTGGETVAGTGTIAADGSVGGIGGIDQKIAGARSDEADLFLVPAENCDDALEAPNGEMELVKVGTMSDAVDAIKTWAADPDADLPRCTEETGEARD